MEKQEKNKLVKIEVLNTPCGYLVLKNGVYFDIEKLKRTLKDLKMIKLSNQKIKIETQKDKKNNEFLIFWVLNGFTIAEDFYNLADNIALNFDKKQELKVFKARVKKHINFLNNKIKSKKELKEFKTFDFNQEIINFLIK